MSDIPDNKKLCSRCGQVLDITMFLTRKGTLMGYCRTCTSEDQRMRRYGYVKYKPTNCEICGKEFTQKNPACMDHNHDNNVIRGWLCRQCNAGLGHFQDSPDNLRNAALYIEKYLNHTETINPYRSRIESSYETHEEKIPEGMQHIVDLVNSLAKNK